LRALTRRGTLRFSPLETQSVRTVIYARFSSDNQNPLSTSDQVAMCRERAAREGWTVVATFEDAAISGAAGIGADQRPGLNALLALVDAGGVDQVLAESTDRVARHVADAHTVRERIEFAGARLFTLFDGTVTPMIGLVKGFMDAQFRTDLGARIRRGQRGAIAQGRSPSPVGYGYRRVARFDDRGEAVRGLREVDEDQAEVIRRIFREFAAGRSANAIARTLNQEGVPAPRSGLWRAGAIRGESRTGSGMLRNQAYIGVIAYGRTRMVVNPTTRRRQMRATGEPPVLQSAPHLRIVDDATWAAVRDRFEESTGQRPERMRRPRHLLSGLGVCGVCGGPWNKISGERWGCGRRHGGGGAGCDNNREILTGGFERRVLADLKARMLAPDVVTAYVREYHQEYARQAARIGRDRGRVERQLAEAGRKLDRLTTAIADGGSAFAEVMAAMTAARDDRDRLARELANMDALPVLALHPGLADRYREAIEELEIALHENEAAKLEAIPRLRAMISRIVVTPSTKKRGVDLEVVRHLDEVLTLATLPRAQRR
jgi:DNA invertase Pin-like site-specific DNA recombinase